MKIFSILKNTQLSKFFINILKFCVFFRYFLGINVITNKNQLILFLSLVIIPQILCRQTHLDEEIYNQLVQKAIDEGYDVSKLHKTPQSDPPPSEEEGPKDTKGFWYFKSLLGKQGEQHLFIYCGLTVSSVCINKRSKPPLISASRLGIYLCYFLLAILVFVSQEWVYVGCLAAQALDYDFFFFFYCKAQTMKLKF